MMPIGEQVGTQLTRSKRLWLIVAACFVIGVIITVAEPDLQVLARQTPAVPDRVLIFTVAAGVGFFLVVSFLRILFGWTFRGCSSASTLWYSLWRRSCRRVPGRGIRFRRRDDGPIQCRSSWRWVWA